MSFTPVAIQVPFIYQHHKKRDSTAVPLFMVPVVGLLSCGKATAGKHPTGVFSGPAFQVPSIYQKHQKRGEAEPFPFFDVGAGGGT